MISVKSRLNSEFVSTTHCQKSLTLLIERRKYYDNEEKYTSINKKLYKGIQTVLEINMEDIIEEEGYTREDFDFSVDKHQNEELSDAINALCTPKM